MRTTALSIAVLLGIATLAAQGDAQAQTVQAVTATVTIESDTVQIGGKHRWSQHRWSKHGWSKHGFRGKAHHRQGLARHHKRFDHPGGRHHRPAFVVKRLHKGPVVIVRPAWGRSFGRSFGHRHLPARPLIRHGSFGRNHHRW